MNRAYGSDALAAHRRFRPADLPAVTYSNVDDDASDGNSDRMGPGTAMEVIDAYSLMHAHGQNI
jgi:hypothetical protein